jgi:hypothetical protein
MLFSLPLLGISSLSPSYLLLPSLKQNQISLHAKWLAIIL